MYRLCYCERSGRVAYIAELDKTILDSTEQMLHSVVLKKIGSVQVQIVLLREVRARSPVLDKYWTMLY